jgi:hypothetical protein
MGGFTRFWRRAPAENGSSCASDRGVRTARALIVAAGLLGLAIAAPASADPSSCVVCHVDALGKPAATAHLTEWRQSKHGSHEIGCEPCHGGDPTAAEARWAHRGVLHSTVPRSPVNRANLPVTCASCHAAQASAFSASLHGALLDVDESRAPSCSTCHGAMDSSVPSPVALEATCAACHPPRSPRGAYPGAARSGIEEIARIRTKLADFSTTIGEVGDPIWRGELRTAWETATQATASAVAAFHAADLRRMAESLDVARRTTDSLTSEFER